MLIVMGHLVGAVLFLLFSYSLSSSLLQNATFNSYPFHTVPSPSFIRVLSSRRPIDCGFSCLRTQSCVSFNFASEANVEKKHVCQLLATNRADHGLTASSFFHHYELILEDPCQNSPCQNGGKCYATSGGREFGCFCPPWFAGRTCERANWVKINKAGPRCFGSRHNNFSPFTIHSTGRLQTMKLVHVSGKITCDVTNAKGWNNWGCLDRDGRHQYMSVIITTSTNSLVLPENKHFLSSQKVYNFSGCNASSPELIFPKFTAPFHVVKDQTYRIWFGLDLDDLTEANNDGTVCVDVFGLYE